MRARTAAMLASFLGLVLTGGCGGEELEPKPWGYDCPSKSSGALAIVLGARQNSPEPQLPKGIEELVVGAADHGRELVAIPVDGKPTLKLEATFSSDASNDVARRDDLVRFVDDFSTAMSKVEAKKPEADPLTALGLAARAVGDGGTIVMLDSGLQTTDPLNFRREGMLDADPKEIAEYLESKNLLPGLEGRSVVFGGLGDVAEPQQSLAGKRQNFVEIWKAIAEQGNAKCVEVLEQPNTDPARDGVPSVSVVSVPKERPLKLEPADEKGCSETVLRNSGSLEFLPDTAEFRDPNAARKQLRTLADQVAGTGHKATLLGTTSSWGTESGRKRISEQRANTVKDALVDLGVPSDKLTAKGVGTKWSGYIDDRGPNNELLLDQAAKNRNVVVRIGCE